jgi:hypothetical protein
MKFGKNYLASFLLLSLGACVAEAPEAEAPEAEEVASTEQALTSYEYVGCFFDSTTRALPTLLRENGANVETCAVMADAAGAPYFGLQWYGQCWAGSSPGLVQSYQSECNTRCDSNNAETCGGGWRNSVYARTPRGNRTYLGCFPESTTRVLPDLLIQSGANVESCQQRARQLNYKYFGLQWFGQCWAGNELPSSGPVNESQCNTPCNTNTLETCGGGWYNSVYAL